jgi:hypothetical protein
MKVIGKILLVFAALMLVGGFFTLFWEETSGKITEYKTLSRTYVGNSGMSAMGANYRSGATVLKSVKYSYTVNKIQYTGYSIRFTGGSSTMRSNPAYYQPTIKVYHSNTFPSLSVIDRGIPLLIIFLISLLGFGLIEMHNWFLKHTKPRKA